MLLGLFEQFTRVLTGSKGGLQIRYHLFARLQMRQSDFVSTSHYLHLILYNNQVNARGLIGQSAVGYDCAGKLMEKSRVF